MPSATRYAQRFASCSVRLMSRDAQRVGELKAVVCAAEYQRDKCIAEATIHAAKAYNLKRQAEAMQRKINDNMRKVAELEGKNA